MSYGVSAAVPWSHGGHEACEAVKMQGTPDRQTDSGRTDEASVWRK